ncbi:MAG: glycosyltransferase [Promethearchaeota archaeon]
MKVFFIGNYLPRRCGIATFTYDLSHALGNESIGFHVAALNNIPEGYDYPNEVVFEIPQHELDKYEDAADFINFSDADVVCLQHEFGIFGGPKGVYICHLMERVKKPIITTLHTIIRKNDEHHKRYAAMLVKIIQLSTKVITISQKGKEILVRDYGIPKEKVIFIPQGVPDVPFVDPSYYKEKFKAEGKIVLLTFGLLSPNKGLETVIEALPPIVKKHPNCVYFVVGVTHPEVKRHQGESYRISLEQRIRQLGLEKNIAFYNQFMSDEQLNQFLGACDIYITLYPNKYQISSGTLARAVGSGKAVVSTPFWHAEELLADERGVLVEFNDIESIREGILYLIEQDVFKNQVRKRAYDFGRQMIWSVVARKYIQTFEEAITLYSPEEKRLSRTYTLPKVNLKYLRRLTDATCIIQHATCGIPNRDKGYSTDDAARALVVALHYNELFRDEKAQNLIFTYLTHIFHAKNEVGLFRNNLSYSHEWLDTEGTEDTQGRTLWGLGTMIAKSPEKNARMLAHRLFRGCIAFASDFQYIRPIAYTINGLYEVIRNYPGASTYIRVLRRLADKLMDRYNQFSTSEWRWYEPVLTYGNAKIPEAMFMAYEILQDEKYLKIAKDSLDFLIETLYDCEKNYFDLIGCKGWYPKGGKRAIFAQQPIDAGYLVAASISAYNITKDPNYIKYSDYAFEWFFGRNRLNKSLYDFESESCYDGIDEQGISINNGAESIICFLLALLKLKKHKLLITSEDKILNTR